MADFWHLRLRIWRPVSSSLVTNRMLHRALSGDQPLCQERKHFSKCAGKVESGNTPILRRVGSKPCQNHFIFPAIQGHESRDRR